MQDSGIVKVDRNKYLTLNRCPLGNYQHDMLNWCFTNSLLSIPKENRKICFWIIKFQAHEILKQHKAATKVVEWPEVKK
jgi:hypothetical protein